MAEKLKLDEGEQFVMDLLNGKVKIDFPKYLLVVDTRGHVVRHLKECLGIHALYRSKIVVKEVNNQKADLIVVRKNDMIDEPLFTVTWLMEFCITDMRAKVMNGQLEKELWGDPINNYLLMRDRMKVDNIAVIGAQTYEPKVYQMLNSKMQACKSIYVHLPTSPANAMEKALKLIVKYSPEPSLFPVLKTNILSKQFGLSISALMNGVSTGMGVELGRYWHKEITEAEISKIVDDFTNQDKPKKERKHYGKLAHKIYKRFTESWGLILEDSEEAIEEEIIEEVNVDSLMAELDRL